MIKIRGEVIINNEKEWNDDLIPSNHSSHNLGSSSKRWSNLYMQGTAYISGSASVGSNVLAGGYVSGDYFSATNAGDSSSSKVLELGYYDFYVDNTGAGSHNSRLWINAPAGGEVVIGPRGGGDWLDNSQNISDQECLDLNNDLAVDILDVVHLINGILNI